MVITFVDLISSDYSRCSLVGNIHESTIQNHNYSRDVGFRRRSDAVASLTDLLRLFFKLKSRMMSDVTETHGFRVCQEDLKAPTWK